MNSNAQTKSNNTKQLQKKMLFMEHQKYMYISRGHLWRTGAVMEVSISDTSWKSSLKIKKYLTNLRASHGYLNHYILTWMSWVWWRPLVFVSWLGCNLPGIALKLLCSNGEAQIQYKNISRKLNPAELMFTFFRQSGTHMQEHACGLRSSLSIVIVQIISC